MYLLRRLRNYERTYVEACDTTATAKAVRLSHHITRVLMDRPTYLRTVDGIKLACIRTWESRHTTASVRAARGGGIYNLYQRGARAVKLPERDGQEDDRREF
jgi:hypothetical protein